MNSSDAQEILNLVEDWRSIFKLVTTDFLVKVKSSYRVRDCDLSQYPGMFAKTKQLIVWAEVLGTQCDALRDIHSMFRYWEQDASIAITLTTQQAAEAAIAVDQIEFKALARTRALVEPSIKGISLRSAASCVESCRREQTKMIKRWWNTKKLPAAIGTAKGHSQRDLFKPSELLDFLEDFYGIETVLQHALSGRFDDLQEEIKTV